MSTTILDILKLDLALAGTMLLRDPAEIEEFRRSVNADAVVTDRGPLNLGKRVLIGKERILLESDISPSIQTIISREYPTAGDLDRLAEVVNCAIEATDLREQQLQGYVCKVDLIYDQDSGMPAATYLANRLFAPDLQSHSGWHLKEGSCRMLFSQGETQWAIFVEPRFGSEETSTVYLSVGQRRDGNRFPDERQIAKILREVWNEALSFMNRLDGESGSD